MPLFVFQGLVETVYPFDRDAAGQPLGAVKPGDARDLDRALDWQWVPADPGAPPAPVSNPAPADPAAADPAAAPEQPDPAPPEAPEAPAAVPAPPAVVPPAGTPFAVTTGQQ